MNQSDYGFAKVMRGYDPDAVNQFIQELNRNLVLTKNQLSEVQQELQASKKQLMRAEADLEQSGAPSYAGLGAKLEHTLRDAEEAALRLISDAELTASGLLTQATEEADNVRSQAEEHYQSKLAAAEESSAHLLNEAQVQAEAILAEARARASEIIEEALREASGIRGAVATEAAELRSTSKREAEYLRSHASLEAAEIKTMALKEVVDTLNVEDILSQQVRQDLEVELAARRFKAEQEYLSKHQEAVVATQSYLDQANSLLSEIIRRLNDKRLEVDTIEAAALSDAKKLREAVRIETDQKLIAADKEALKLIREAKREAKSLINQAKTELQQLDEEKQALKLYFDGITALLTKANTVAAPAKRSRAKKTQPIEAEIVE